MGKTKDLGIRLELQPMDRHCHDISLGLYQREVESVPQFLVHTYGSVSGAEDRVAFLSRALCAILGLEEVPGQGPWLRFPCASNHPKALKRAFLDICRLDSDAELVPKRLAGFDKKANCNIQIASRGNGIYEVAPEQPTDAGKKRAGAVARGYAKLCEMDAVEGESCQVKFGCQSSHDALIGFLLYRAQNVRAAMQEEESAASAGVLAPPSQQ